MSWRIATRHVSRYHYRAPVTASYNEARMSPSTGPGQLVLDSGLEVTPRASLYRYVDYWATMVHAFEVQVPHEELVVTGTSLVETASGSGLGAGQAGDDAPTWEQLSSPLVRDRHAELLQPTPYAPFDPDLAAEARCLAVAATPAETVDLVARHVRTLLAYRPGSTEVSTSAVEAWQQGSGVCQDFAHLALSMLRQLGIPARYTSGYLHPSPGAAIGETVVGASHAWVEAWLGRFVAVDPTNGDPVAERHVTVAHGRDYGDVPPLRGVYHGGELDELVVEVELTRVA